MRKHLYAAGAILAAILVFVVSGSGPMPVRAQNDPGSRALRYLASQQSATTGAEPAGFSPYDTSELYAIGAAAAGYDPNALRNGAGPSVIDYLKSNAGAATADGGNTGRLLLAAVAAGQDVTSFGGVNLVTRLNTFYAGGFYQANSAQGQALAILGLKAAGQPVPQPAIDVVKKAQDADGGWDYLLVANDPSAATNFDTSDTNSTAFALMALAAVGDHSLDARALAWLRTQQQADGGFAYQGSPSDPDSTALVLQALVATGQNLAGCAFNQSGRTPLAYLVSTQDASGGYLGYSGVDPGTTAMAVAGVLGQAFPVISAYGPNQVMATEQRADQRALQYLASQQSATTGAGPAGFSPYDTSELYAIGAAAAGYDPNALRNGAGPSVIDYLKSNAGAATADGGNTGRLLLAAVAAGQDVTSFGGVNLVTRLNTFYAGGFYQANSAQGQALAILGLKAAGQPVPQPAIDVVKKAQDADGGWDYLLVANDPSAATNFDTSDTNSTAFALMALAAVGDHSLDARALAWLRTQQQADGGFAYQGSPSDPDSTALVLQALIATAQDPGSATWAPAGNSSVMYLLATQDASGGYAGYSGVDPGTTAMAAAGLERVYFPVFPAYVAGTALTATPGPVAADRLPAQLCPAAPTPTPAPAATATPTPSATPVPVLTATPTASAPEAAASAAEQPSPSATPAPTPTASPEATPAPVQATAEPGPTVQPSAGSNGKGGAGGIPPSLLYALVAAAALGAVVLVGGIVLYLRR